MTTRLVLAMLILVTPSLGCTSDASFDDSVGVERKPASAFDQSDDLTTKRKIFHATYKMTVTMKRMGTVLCEGDAELVGYSDFSTETLGDIKCRGGQSINLGEMMGGEIVPADPDVARQLAHFGKVGRLKQQGQTTYDPPLPFALGPIIQNVTDFEGLNFSEPMRVDHVNESGVHQSGDGVVHVEVLGAGISYQPEGYPETFRSVLHWQRRAEGFKGVDRGEAMLFDSFEYWWNVRPIAIPRMRIEGPLGNFMPRMSGIGSLLGVTLIIDMVLSDHRQL